MRGRASSYLADELALGRVELRRFGIRTNQSPLRIPSGLQINHAPRNAFPAKVQRGEMADRLSPTGKLHVADVGRPVASAGSPDEPALHQRVQRGEQTVTDEGLAFELDFGLELLWFTRNTPTERRRACGFA